MLKEEEEMKAISDNAPKKWQSVSIQIPAGKASDQQLLNDVNNQRVDKAN